MQNLYRKKRLEHYSDLVLRLFSGLNYLMSLTMIIALIYEYGLWLSPSEQMAIHNLYDWVRYIFLINTTLHVALEFKTSLKTYGKLNLALQILLFLTLIPILIPIKTYYEWIDIILSILDSYYYKTAIIGTLSFFQLSNGIVLLLSKRLNQSLVFSISFLIVIFIGAGMLMLPRSTYNSIPFIDALFISTSATCVTGLSTVDITSTFTPIGLTIILILIQIGGIGVMTLACFFAMTFKNNTTISNQSQMSDLLNAKSLSTLMNTMGYILGFTLIIEGIGAIIILCCTHGTLNMTIYEEIAFSIFHSISAFCNAGFSTLPGNLGNEMLMKNGNNIFYLSISALIILGGIGFPILVNLYTNAKINLKQFKKQHFNKSHLSVPLVHFYSTNTRIVLIMTAILLIGGTFGIALLEWNNVFADIPLTDKIVQSFFTAVCPRTAGFNSYAVSSFSRQSIMLIMLLMIIGGGTQSTAGGIKVNVFAMIFLNLRAIIFGTPKVVVFQRQLSDTSVRNSNSTLILYVFFLFTGVFVLSFFEPNTDIIVLFFECISAISTVGASLDLTPQLQIESKIVITILMFVGRIGVLTMITSLIRQKINIKYKFPSDNIIIN